MNIKTISFAAFIFCLIAFNHPTAAAQSLTPGGNAGAAENERKFEVGAQFTVIRVDNNPASFFNDGRRSEPGFGGRLAYNLSRYVALESEINFFPRNYRGFITNHTGGRITQGLFGVKAGVRKQRFGVFGKARPGFMRYHRTVESVNFPDGSGPDPRDRFGFELGSTTHLALDVGGVIEHYPSRRTILRLDIGDTIVRYASIPVFNTNRGLIDLTRYRHNAQVSIGFGFRF